MTALEVVREVPLLIGKALGCVGVGVEEERGGLDGGGVDMDLGPGSAVWSLLRHRRRSSGGLILPFQEAPVKWLAGPDNLPEQQTYLTGLR